MPVNFLPDYTIDTSYLGLRRNTSLTRAEVFRNFEKIRQELLTYFESNKQLMGDDDTMQGRYDKLMRIDLFNMKLRDVCFILQLRYTLSV